MKQLNRFWMKYSALGSCLLLTLAMSILIKYYFLPVEKDIYLFLFVLPALVLTYFCDLYKRNAILYVGLFAFLLSGAGGIYFFDRDILKQMREAVSWFCQYDGKLETYIWQYGRSILAVFCLVTTILCYLICHMGKWQYVVDLVIVVFVILLTIWQIPLEKLSGICMALYLIDELSKIAYFLWYKQKDRKRADKTAAYLLPIFIAMGIMMGMLPYRETPIKWERIKKAYTVVKERTEKIGYDLSCLLEHTGDNVQSGLFYSSNSKQLGGNLQTKERDWLEVWLNSKTHDAVYMVASYKEAYEDGRWKAAENLALPIKEEQLDYYELIYSVLREEELDDYESIFRNRHMKVNYVNIKTNTFFSPSKTKSIQSEKLDFEYTGSGIMRNKINGYDTQYDCDFAEWNRGSPRMIQKMKSSATFSYKELGVLPLGSFKTRAKIGVEAKKTNIYEKNTVDLNAVLAERADYIKVHYTQLPEDFSEEVKMLAERSQQIARMIMTALWL